MLKTLDNSKDRIIEAAEANFRRYGYSKTTVADIAKDAGMSPANVYRFFDSKGDIVGAIAELWLGEMEAYARRIALRDAPASDRLRAYVLEIHAATVERYLDKDKEKIHEMCQMVISEQWPVVKGHIERMREILTLIVEAGVQSGEFAVKDAGQAAETVKNALMKFHHPSVVAQCASEPLADQAKDLVALLLRGLTARD
jgi:AcrR family transcriptional regulator